MFFFGFLGLGFRVLGGCLGVLGFFEGVLGLEIQVEVPRTKPQIILKRGFQLMPPGERSHV